VIGWVLGAGLISGCWIGVFGCGRYRFTLSTEDSMHLATRDLITIGVIE